MGFLRCTHDKEFFSKRRRRLQLGGSGGILPQKMLKFRVSEMPSPGFSAGHFQYIMRQKCSRKLFI